MCLFLLFSFLSPAFAADKNWMMRVRGITVNPDESGTPTLIGGEAKLSNESVPEVDFSYFITNNFAVELILATTTHDVYVANSSLNGLDLGNVSLLPPTLLVQYHHQMNKFKPYVGVGINYTHFYGVKAGELKTVTYDDSFGYAFQLGGDYEIASDVYLNYDIKKVLLSTDLTATTYSNATVTADVDIDPWIVGLGIGYRF
jgi:outer membrane protein